MGRLAQWDSKVLDLNSTDGFDWAGLVYFGKWHKATNACKKRQIYIYIYNLQPNFQKRGLERTSVFRAGLPKKGGALERKKKEEGRRGW